jgi:hypothetical protein
VVVLVAPVCLGKLFVLSSGVVQKLVDLLPLPGLWDLLVVFLQNTFDVAMLGPGDPLENMLLRLVALFQIDPVGMVVPICRAFDVNGLLNDLLRALGVDRGERDREYTDPEKLRFFPSHWTALTCWKATRF